MRRARTTKINREPWDRTRLDENWNEDQPGRLDWNRTFKTKELCKIFKVAPRAIQYWSEQKLLNPTLITGVQGGSIRQFGMLDFIVLGIMLSLRRKNLSLIRVRAVVRMIQPEIKRRYCGVFLRQSSRAEGAAFKATRKMNRTAVKVACPTKNFWHIVKVRDILKRIK